MLTIGLHMHVGLEQTRRLVDGVLRYMAEHPELALYDFNYPTNTIDLPEFPPWLGRADAVVTNVSRVPNVVKWLRSGGVPVVNTTADMKNDIVSVFTDPKSLARLAVDHFVKLSRPNIAYIGYRHADGSQDRAQALAQATKKHRIPFASYDTDQRFTGTYEDFATLDNIEPGLLALIRDTPKPMAVLAVNDRWAVTVCRIVLACGFSIPGDVAVLGVEDLDKARVAEPTISSIRTAGERIGYEATHMAHQLIRGGLLSPRSMALPAIEVVARQSTVGKIRAPATDIDRAREYIRTKACERIRIEDVAKHVHIPLRTFELQFASAVGHSVGEELRMAKLARAKQLLTTSDMPLARIAHQVGLSSAPALVGFMRRWAGQTPNEYRKDHRAKSRS